jgi:hypothetical protein
MTVAATLVVCTVPLGEGDGAPHVGTSPANADTERMHVRTIIIRDRFMEVSP